MIVKVTFIDSNPNVVMRQNAPVYVRVAFGAPSAGGGGSTDWTDIINKPSTFTPSSHSHAIADVNGLQTALDGKQVSGSYATTSQVNAKQDSLVSGTNIKTINGDSLLGSGNLAISGGEPVITPGTTSQYWRGDKTFQTLDKAAVGLASVDNTSDTNKPVSAAQQTALNGKANISHSHAIADVTGLQTSLDGKANTSHSHAIADVTGLQTALDGKANTSHTHTRAQITDFTHTHPISEVTGLQTALDGKQASGSYAAASHSHVIGDVTGLQAALDGKASTSHTHTKAQITDFAHTHVIGDTTGLQTALDGKAASSHSHAISDVTGLQTALDAKQKTITSGTAAPSGGSDGDIYLQYT